MTTDRETSHDPALGASSDRIDHRPSPWGMALAALLAALIAWAVGESPLVQVSARAVPIVTMGTASVATTAESEIAAISTRSIRSQGVFGALIGLAMGAAGGLARRSPRRAISGAIIGMIVGAIAGMFITSLGIPLYSRLRESMQDDLIPSLLLHGTTGAAIGSAAALALGIGARLGRISLLRSVLGGALGAVVGAVAFVILGAVLFPLDGTGEPIATSAVARLLARLLVAVSIALGMKLSA